MPPEDDTRLARGRPKRGRITLVIGIAAVALMAAGVWIRGTRSDAASAAPEPTVRSTLHLETFVLNLSDPDQRAYLRVGIDLGLNSDLKHGETPAPVAEIRDTILTVLAQGRLDELLTADGKTKLKENLLHALQQRMPELGVEQVYFTEFLIQR